MMGDSELAAKLAAIEAHYQDLIRRLDREILIDIAEIKADIRAARKSLFRAAWVIFITVLAILANRYPGIAEIISALKGV